MTAPACAFNQQASASCYGRDTETLLTYEQDGTTLRQLPLDIQRALPDAANITDALQQQAHFTADGQLKHRFRNYPT